MNLEGPPYADGGVPSVNLNLNVRGLDLSATLAINERSAQLRHDGRRIFRLGLGQSPFPVPRAVVEELRNHAHEKDYLPVRGLRELREAVADYHRRTKGGEFTGKDILVGPGSKEPALRQRARRHRRTHRVDRRRAIARGPRRGVTLPRQAGRPVS